MPDHNPYQAPPDLEPKEASASREFHSIGMEFESDWSAEGLRRRRKSDWQRLGDFAFGFLSIAWVVSFVSATHSPFGGLFCLLTPAWIICGVIWFSNVTYRTGGGFPSRFSGLAGPVSGRVDGGWVRIDGPAIRIAARVIDCPQCSLFGHRAFIQPPGIDTSLPIAATDIQRTWRSETRVADRRAFPIDLLAELSGDQEQCIVAGTVRGTDLRGQSCWRLWRSIGITCTAIGLAGLILAIYLLANLPPWVVNRPSHYRWSDADVNSLSAPILIILVSLMVLAVGVWNLLKTFRELGDFAALITPQMIAIANHRVALGYHGSALAHFQWTERGMVVRNAAQRVMFLIPARWFAENDRQLASSWHSRGTQAAESNAYIGPSI